MTTIKQAKPWLVHFHSSWNKNVNMWTTPLWHSAHLETSKKIQSRKNINPTERLKWSSVFFFSDRNLPDLKITLFIAMLLLEFHGRIHGKRGASRAQPKSEPLPSTDKCAASSLPDSSTVPCPLGVAIASWSKVITWPPPCRILRRAPSVTLRAHTLRERTTSQSETQAWTTPEKVRAIPHSGIGSRGKKEKN